MKRALIPDRQLKISEPESKPVKYFKEDSNLINDLEGREQADRQVGRLSSLGNLAFVDNSKRLSAIELK